MIFGLNRLAEGKILSPKLARCFFLRLGAITERLRFPLLSCDVILAWDLTGAPPTAVITTATRCQCLTADAQVTVVLLRVWCRTETDVLSLIYVFDGLSKH